MMPYDNVRLFDFLHRQLEKYPDKGMLYAKENSEWKGMTVREVATSVDELSAGLLALGLGNSPLPLEEQMKVAVISKNRPE